MEKTISPEERIKRAEEIYYRRRSDNNSVRMSSRQVRDDKEKKQFYLYKKMIIQVLVCILIYLVFSLIKQANYIFSEDVLNKTKEFLSTDINFEVIAGQVGQFFQDNQDKLDFLSSWLKDDKQNNNSEKNLESDENKTSSENNNQVNNQENNNKQDNEQQNNEKSNTTNETKTNTSSKNNSTVTNSTTGIGGASGNEAVVSTSSNTSSSKKTQMQLDAEYIKKNFSLMVPAKAAITSRYGAREATEIVSANHYGIDIGVNVGTTIVAAMDGKVSLVSNEGEYGTHVKIVNKDVTTIYAHCSKILVKKGATIKKGQKIALSGNTGRTTGPHLHFEIRRDNRPVDPQLVLSNLGKS